MNILFRCDGSIEIGMGHVVRCRALADELSQNHNSNITFAMRTSKLGIEKVNKLYPVLISKEKNNAFNYENWIVDCINKTNAKILVLDVRDGLSREELKKIKNSTGIKVVTIDDPEDKRLETDLAFYPPVPQLEKTDWSVFKGELFIGWNYVLLRKEFSKKYPEPDNPIPNIFVSMGGTDENNITQFVVEALQQVTDKFHVNIILGPGYQDEAELKLLLAGINYGYFIYEDPINIAGIMSQSDLAIISFGQTAYELAALGVPSIYVCISDDHVESSQLFVNEGIGISLGNFTTSNKENMRRTIYESLNHTALLYDMSKKTKSLNISDLSHIATLISE